MTNELYAQFGADIDEGYAYYEVNRFFAVDRIRDITDFFDVESGQFTPSIHGIDISNRVGCGFSLGTQFPSETIPAIQEKNLKWVSWCRIKCSEWKYRLTLAACVANDLATLRGCLELCSPDDLIELFHNDHQRMVLFVDRIDPELNSAISIKGELLRQCWLRTNWPSRFVGLGYGMLAVQMCVHLERFNLRSIAEITRIVRTDSRPFYETLFRTVCRFTHQPRHNLNVRRSLSLIAGLYGKKQLGKLIRFYLNLYRARENGFREFKFECNRYLAILAEFGPMLVDSSGEIAPTAWVPLKPRKMCDVLVSLATLYKRYESATYMALLLSRGIELNLPRRSFLKVFKFA